jgi:LytB protein
MSVGSIAYAGAFSRRLTGAEEEEGQGGGTVEFLPVLNGPLVSRGSATTRTRAYHAWLVQHARRFNMSLACTRRRVLSTVAYWKPRQLPGPLGVRWMRTEPAMAQGTARMVLLASPRSLCAGVERAVQIVERALEVHGPPVFVRKQIVHNAHVVADLRARGRCSSTNSAKCPRAPSCRIPDRRR